MLMVCIVMVGGDVLYACDVVVPVEQLTKCGGAMRQLAAS
jgi:hypothetical protein